LRGDSPPLLCTAPAAAAVVAAAAAVAGDECAYCAAPECALKGLMLSRHSPGGVVRVAIGTAVVTAAVAVAAVAVSAVPAAELCRVIKHSGCSISRAVTPASEPCVCS
jgi:hypothetical protein